MTDPYPLLKAWSTWQYAQSLSRRTVTERTSTVRNMARYTGTDPADVTTDQVVEWLASGEWQPTTRATYYTTLRAWFSWLQTQGHRTDNPMVTVGKPRRPRAEPRPVSDDHLRRLLATRMHRRTRLMILLAALAGLRIHEIAKVRGEHVDIRDRTITVIGKGGHRATIPMHPMLTTYAAEMPRTGFWFPSNSTRDGAPHMHARSVGNTIKRAMIRAGVPGSAHQLRHWYGSALVESGADLRTTQDLLRHASLATTQIYTKVADHRRAEAVDRLDPFVA